MIILTLDYDRYLINIHSTLDYFYLLCQKSYPSCYKSRNNSQIRDFRYSEWFGLGEINECYQNKTYRVFKLK